MADPLPTEVSMTICFPTPCEGEILTTDDRSVQLPDNPAPWDGGVWPDDSGPVIVMGPTEAEAARDANEDLMDEISQADVGAEPAEPPIDVIPRVPTADILRDRLPTSDTATAEILRERTPGGPIIRVKDGRGAEKAPAMAWWEQAANKLLKKIFESPPGSGSGRGGSRSGRRPSMLNPQQQFMRWGLVAAIGIVGVMLLSRGGHR